MVSFSWAAREFKEAFVPHVNLTCYPTNVKEHMRPSLRRSEQNEVFFLPVQPVCMEPCNSFTDSSIVCRSKTSTVLWVPYKRKTNILASFCPFKHLFGSVKMGSEATCSLVILQFFYFSLLRDLSNKPFSTSIKKMVTLFSRDIFNTIIWNIKKCSTNRDLIFSFRKLEAMKQTSSPVIKQAVS